MQKRKKGRKVALVAGLALVVLSVSVGWTYWGEIRFFLKFERLGLNEQGHAEYRHRETGIVFVALPGGTFEMGSPESEEGRSEVEKLHRVVLTRFLIAKYEVSNEIWNRCREDSQLQSSQDKYPVRYVTWLESWQFCGQIGLDLPTEAQCRAPDLPH